MRAVSLVASLVLVSCGGASSSDTPDVGSVDASAPDVATDFGDVGGISFDVGDTSCSGGFSGLAVTPSVPEIVVDLDGAAPSPVVFSAALADPPQTDVTAASSFMVTWSALDAATRKSLDTLGAAVSYVAGPVGGTFAGATFAPSRSFIGHVAFGGVQVTDGACAAGYIDVNVVALHSTAGAEDLLIAGYGSRCGPPPSPPATSIGRFRHVAPSSGGPVDVGVALGSDASFPFSAPIDVLVASVRAVTEGDAAKGCVAHAAVDTNGDGVLDKFTAVAPAETVCFEVTAKATPSALYCNLGIEPRHFEAYVDVVEGAATVRERHAIVVGEARGACDPPC